MAKKTTANTRPALYNPAAVAALALLFTPVFGAQLQALNWQTLGEQGEMRSSRMWVRTTFWLILVFIIMQAIFRNEPLMRFGGLYFLIVAWASWMVTSGYRQITYVKDLFGNDYPRRRIGRPIMIGAGGWVIYSMVSVSVGMLLALTGIDPIPTQTESTGVMIRVPEGSDKPVVEPLPPKENAAPGAP